MEGQSPPPPPPEIKKSKTVSRSAFLVACVALIFSLALVAVTYSQVNSLQQQYTILNGMYTQSQSNYNTLYSNYNDLQSRYNSLQTNYNTLNSEHTSMSSDYSTLSSDVDSLYKLLFSYADLTSSFSRTLNDAAIKATSSVVASQNGGSQWPTTQNIYNYITSNIKYVNDIDMPYISGMTLGDGVHISHFTTSTVQNYIQTPALTLSIKQGDCDDQATLAYAMIKYYMKYIAGTEYTLYLARIVFNDGSSHVAVFIPVTGGNVCVLDPAGSYLTRHYGAIYANPASTELQNYSSHWASTGIITQITLYNINVVDGSYTTAASGTVSQIAAALS